ncbi:MAG: TonB-dependent receptor [Gemmatimonadota bacterium]|nr:TonB-dependent receptor [Gemmatimonadota bacterium]
MRSLQFLSILSSLLLFPLGTVAQGPSGTVAGTVVDQSNGQPLSGVQVFIPDGDLGTLTNAQGRFILVNVPAGEHTLRAEILGYTPASRTVTVGAEETTQVDFSLPVEALGLDEIVVTGTAGQARRREVGNTVEQLNMDRMSEPMVNVESALQGQAPGVNILQTSGTIGAGSQIRLRGNVSVAMGSQPLVYVDGVRVYGEAYPSMHGRDAMSGRGAATASSAINDINPDNIERVEIVKGPAATTLYGTEASAGVIQIFTKRGQTGDARWTAQTRQGFAKVQPFAPKGATYGAEDRKSEFLYIDPWLGNGHWQQYGLSVSGGSGDLGYFLSGAMEDNQAVLPNDKEERYSVRGNLDFEPLPGLNVQWNTSFTSDAIQRTSMGNNAQGLALNAYRLDQNYFGSGDKEFLDQILEFEITEDITRFTTGLNARHTAGNLSNRFTLGYDVANWEGRQVRRFGFILFERGAVGNLRWTLSTLSADYVGSYAFDLPAGLRSTFSWGAQSVTETRNEVEGYGEDLPGPGEPTVTSGANRLAWENRQRVVTAGGFVQNVLDIADRYFLTLGLRVDGNSAFGSDFGLQAYPKVSGSYVLSDEEFWPDAWGSVRLRGAYGHAGRAPGAFDAVRTWDPASYAGSSAFQPRNLGNPNLGPERTKEAEVGLETSHWDDRISSSFTYYRQVTEDALFDVQQVPSNGNWPSQLENVGKLRNSGIELSVDASILEGPAFGWDAGVSLSTNHSRVLDMGGAPPFMSNDMRIEEGKPLCTWTPRRIMNPHEQAEPVVSTDPDDLCHGPAWPTHILQVRNTFDLPGGIGLSARGEFQGGHYSLIGPTSSAVGRGNTLWPVCLEANRLWDEGRDDEVKAWDRLRCRQSTSSSDWNVSPADFFKIRNISLTAPVASWIPGTSDATLSLSARNIRLYKDPDMELFDPEMGGSNWGPESGSRRIREHIPAPMRFSAQLQVNW